MVAVSRRGALPQADPGLMPITLTEKTLLLVWGRSGALNLCEITLGIDT